MKLLIELPTWLGDTVMATPAIDNLIGHYNEPKITLIGSSISTEILKNHPYVVKTYILNRNYKELYKTANELSYFDVFISFRSSIRSRFMKFFVSSEKKYQFFHNNYQNRHQVEKYNDFINDSLNTNYLAGRLNFHWKSSFTYKHLTLGINPGSSFGSAKRWYPKEFAKVAINLSNQYDIIIFGDSKETQIANDIEKLLIEGGVKNYQNLSGNTSISELINLISKLDLFITCDSGPMHLAATFQVPTVTIFGPTKDSETSQWMNQNSVIVKKNLNCQPCMKRRCPLKHHQCMSMIKAEDVSKAIYNLDLKDEK